MRKDDLLDLALDGRDVDAPADVRELAELADALRRTWDVAPSPRAGKGWGLAMEAFRAGDPGSSNGHVVSRAAPIRRRFLTAATLAAVLVIGLAGGAVAGSQQAIPGDALYPVKMLVERARLASAGDSVAEARVLLEQARERLEEVERARSKGDAEAAAEAASGYDEALVAFGLRVADARAQGLPIDSLVQAAESFPPGQAVSDMTPGSGDGSLLPSDEDDDEGGPPSDDEGNDNGNGKAKGHGKDKGNQGNQREPGNEKGDKPSAPEEPEETDDPEDEKVKGENTGDDEGDDASDEPEAEEAEEFEDQQNDGEDEEEAKKPKPPKPTPSPKPSGPGKKGNVVARTYLTRTAGA